MALVGDRASFREDDVFEGETCQKSVGFHHLGKNSSDEGKAACEAKTADLALLFAPVTPARRKGTDGVLRATPIDENRPISGRTPLEKRYSAIPDCLPTRSFSSGRPRSELALPGGEGGACAARVFCARPVLSDGHGCETKPRRPPRAALAPESLKETNS